MKSFSKNYKIYHIDTDCYGVVWHGSYLRFFEEGRVEFADLLGTTLQNIETSDVLLPVVEINLRFKQPAKLYDEIKVETSLKELRKTSLVFYQEITNVKTGNLLVTAEITCVTTDMEGKMYRKIPDNIHRLFSFAEK